MLRLLARDDELELVKFFVENGANIDKKHNLGSTPLLVAAHNNNFEVVQYLVEKGAEINIRDNEGKTAASVAYDKRFTKVYDYLKEHGTLDFAPLPQQAAAPPTSYGSSGSSGSSGGSSGSSSGGSSVADSLAKALSSPLQAGTYALAGTQAKMEFQSFGKSGMVWYTNRQGKQTNGNYTIKDTTVNAEGYTFVYTITSTTSFTGHGETWVRTGF